MISVYTELTGNNIGAQLAINLDGACVSRPAWISSRIVGDGVIEGQFTEAEVRVLVSILNAGPLPAPLTLEEEHTAGGEQ